MAKLTTKTVKSVSIVLDEAVLEKLVMDSLPPSVLALGRENIAVVFGGDEYHAYSAEATFKIEEHSEEEL